MALTNPADASPMLPIHGRRLGIIGDGQSGGSSLLQVDNQLIAATRSGPAPLFGSITSLSGAGSIVLPGAAVGDTVLRVYTAALADVSADFEATISVAGHIAQTISTAGAQVLVIFQPQS